MQTIGEIGFFAAAAAALAGALAGSLLACVPGLHVYNVLGAALLAVHGSEGRGTALPGDVAAPFAIGMVVGYAVLNTVPSILLGAPDESALFTVLPGQKLLMQGRGLQAVMLTAAGSLAGLAALVFGAGPLAPRIVPHALTVLRPHMHWILWCVICFMLMSEWPKGGNLGPAGWRRLADAWMGPAVGLLTFALSGLLGFILFYRSPIAPGAAFQNLMPGFVGLFTLPWLLLNLASRVEIPQQARDWARAGPDGRQGLDWSVLLRGGAAGTLGGGLAAFFPAVTGGVGGLLAGHMTAIRDDRVFLVSQGASKVVYYAGGLLLLFVPGAHLTRGGAAWMLKGVYTPAAAVEYGMAVAAVALAGAVSFFLVAPLTRAVLAAAERFGYRRLCTGALVAVTAIVAGITGAAGLGVMLVATGIGLIPVLYGSRRMNCLGVILLPVACNMSGWGDDVAQWLRLL